MAKVQSRGILMLTIEGFPPELSVARSETSALNQEEFAKTLNGYQDVGNFQGACDHIEKMLERFPAAPSLYLARASCLMNLKNGEGAVTDLNKALSLHPDKATLINIYRLMGVCQASLGNELLGLEYWTKAAALGDQYSQSVLVLATGGLTPKKTISSSYPFDYNASSKLQEIYEDK